MIRFARALVAVVIGNALYFVVVAPLLPPWLRHSPYRIDAGLLLDFAICSALYLVLARVAGVRRGGGQPGAGGDGAGRGGVRW